MSKKPISFPLPNWDAILEIFVKIASEKLEAAEGLLKMDADIDGLNVEPNQDVEQERQKKAKSLGKKALFKLITNVAKVSYRVLPENDILSLKNTYPKFPLKGKELSQFLRDCEAIPLVAQQYSSYKPDSRQNLLGATFGKTSQEQEEQKHLEAEQQLKEWFLKRLHIDGWISREVLPKMFEKNLKAAKDYVTDFFDQYDIEAPHLFPEKIKVIWMTPLIARLCFDKWCQERGADAYFSKEDYHVVATAYPEIEEETLVPLLTHEFVHAISQETRERFNFEDSELKEQYPEIANEQEISIRKLFEGELDELYFLAKLQTRISTVCRGFRGPLNEALTELTTFFILRENGKEVSYESGYQEYIEALLDFSEKEGVSIALFARAMFSSAGYKTLKEELAKKNLTVDEVAEIIKSKASDQDQDIDPDDMKPDIAKEKIITALRVLERDLPKRPTFEIEPPSLF